MEPRYPNVSIEVFPLDHIEKSQFDLVEEIDVSQSADFKSNSTFDKLGKRKRGCELGNHSCIVASPLKNYENFKRSGLITHLFYHDDGKWIDFPKEVTELVRKEFQMKHVVVEVKWYNSRFILDVLYMMKFDINTGMQKAIGWIDEAGCCFFPELCEHHDANQPDSYAKPIARDVNLHLQIEINGFHANNVDANGAGKKSRIEKTCDGANSDNSNTYENDFGVGSAMNSVSYSELDSSSVNVSRSFHIEMDINKVHEMFCAGMESLCPSVTEIKLCSSKFLKNRLELFDTLAKHTSKLRGSSNIRYAWLPCARKDVPSIISYGIGVGVLTSIAAYGYGVHLSSESHAYNSVNNCDDDENGIRHMLLCRVVLGKVELVHLGSDQCCPSNEQFDTGVDNILDPQVYIVWEMNAITHIYPECVVSFKLASRPEVVAYSERKVSNEASVVQVGPGLHFDSSILHGTNYHPGTCIKNESQVRTTALKPSSPYSPRSPWMPFPVLLGAIVKKVSPKTMQVVYHHYYAFKCKKIITRSEFVKRLQMIVGDALLKSTITSLQSELRPPTPPIPEKLKAPKPEPEA